MTKMQTPVGLSILSPLQCQNILAAQLKSTETVDFIFEIKLLKAIIRI